MQDNPQQQRQPTGPVSRSRPTEEQSLAARKYFRWFLLLLVLMLLTTNLVLPWKVISLAAGIAAITLGIITMVKLFQFRQRALLKISAGAGVAVAFLMTLGVGAMILVWPHTQEYEECMRLALTLQTQTECTENYLTLGGLLPAR